MTSEWWQVQRNLGQWRWHSRPTLNGKCSVRVTDWYTDPWKVLEWMELFCPWFMHMVLLWKAEQMGEKAPYSHGTGCWVWGWDRRITPLEQVNLLSTEKAHSVVQCSSHIWGEIFTTGKMGHKGTLNSGCTGVPSQTFHLYFAVVSWAANRGIKSLYKSAGSEELKCVIIFCSHQDQQHFKNVAISRSLACQKVCSFEVRRKRISWVCH